MKNLINGLALVIVMLSLCSCTKVVYTHEQVLDSYKTKADVIKKFGAPTERKTGETSIEWLYTFDRAKAFTDHSYRQVTNAKTLDVTEFNRHKRYVIFTMDMQGNVVKWDYEGVDLAVRKSAPGRTIALVLGGVGLIALLVVGMYNIFDNWSFY